jgi:hypothetical protein
VWVGGWVHHTWVWVWVGGWVGGGVDGVGDQVGGCGRVWVNPAGPEGQAQKSVSVGGYGPRLASLLNN